jgi:hypothetical protein
MTYEKPELHVVDQAHVAILMHPCHTIHKPSTVADDSCGVQLTDAAYSVDE